MEKTFKIIETDWTEVKPLWSEHLWPLRLPDYITPISSMIFCGGFDTDIKKNRPSFWIAEQDGVIVGTISGFKTADKQYRSRGIWIHQSVRGQGLSLELFRTVQDRAVEQQCNMIWSYPRLTALSAYKKFGFNAVGNVVEDDDPYSPHVYVSKNI